MRDLPYIDISRQTQDPIIHQPTRFCPITLRTTRQRQVQVPYSTSFSAVILLPAIARISCIATLGRPKDRSGIVFARVADFPYSRAQAVKSVTLPSHPFSSPFTPSLLLIRPSTRLLTAIKSP
jgi:hypothetical protein